MMILVVAAIACIVPMVPALIFFLRKRGKSPVSLTRGLVLGLNGFNLVLGLMAAGFGLVWLASPHTVMAAGLNLQAASSNPYSALGAAISTGLATLGAGFAVASTGSAAIGAIAEKPETFGRSLVFVGLAEGIGIYGLIIAVLILNQ